MFIDAREVAERDTLHADLCIVGTGAAGLSLALQFADTSTRVVLLEVGGAADDADGRGIYKVVHGSIPRLVTEPGLTSRFGGNTNHWFGNCRPLDDADFEPRDWIPYSGWPMRRDHLLPFYEQAQILCGLGSFRDYDAEAIRPHLAHPPIDVDPAMLTPKVIQTCPVLSFAQRYRERIEEAGNVQVYLHARAIRLETNARGDDVGAVEVGAGDGRRFRVAARVFVLAAGGIENPRLLLCSNDANANGLGNEHDLVGRFFMEHPFLDIPLVQWDHGYDLVFHTEPQQAGGAIVWGQMALSEALMREERVTGMGMFFVPRFGLRVVSPGRVKDLLLGRPRLEDLITEIHNLRTDAAAVAAHVARRVARRTGPGTPHIGDALRVTLEHAPDPQNRIRLSSQRDAFGQPGADLIFRLTDAEQQGHVRALRIAAHAFGLNGRRIARQLQLMLRAGRMGFFWHHMGTSRMHPDPTQGVVDSDCRVHRVSNLFVAGSSVFPTAGTAAPTLTIVALALRLAQHIRKNYS